MEFSRWETLINEGDISVLSVVYGCQNWYLSGQDTRYEYRDLRFSDEIQLTVTVFHEMTESVYEIQFRQIGGHRVLDEHGLLEMWGSKNPKDNCFKVRGHQWTHESPLSFELNTVGGWSYVIASDWDCVEVLTHEDPTVVLVERLTNLKRPKK
ncbi:hypothetical protein [Vibrio tapetis]|uniref:Uncharacterized protein n=1 Tax=Vibrio tapetis subsp. tapetis TaxID=1671868 RepID=A0A2N8ZN85_9VIBR|nr:hypothetical protein [Vibrio tapetis]SON53319.1 conserved protein of unknown function [Vibrio tapetis subsp. tapetis]